MNIVNLDDLAYQPIIFNSLDTASVDGSTAQRVDTQRIAFGVHPYEIQLKVMEPKPERVIINEPATITFFDDGTKVVTKCGEGDEYDPLFGIMACCLRKVGKNRVRIDSWEPIINILSGYLADAKECRVIADMLNATADALDTDGAMEQLEEYDERNKTEFDPTSLGEAMDASSISTGTIREVDEVKADVEELDGRVAKVEGAVSSYERTRQTIRNLIDKGEL